MADIFRKTLADRERRAGVDAGEAGKSWDESFGTKVPNEPVHTMSQAQFTKGGKPRGSPPKELMKKHEQ